jgi:hypothetical protein
MDALELLALAYGWPPEVGRAMSPEELGDWLRRAGKRAR